MKPDWKEAPEWAQWLAMDKDRDWFWYEKKPTIEKQCMFWCTEGRYQYAEPLQGISSWDESREERPK